MIPNLSLKHWNLLSWAKKYAQNFPSNKKNYDLFLSALALPSKKEPITYTAPVINMRERKA